MLGSFDCHFNSLESLENGVSRRNCDLGWPVGLSVGDFLFFVSFVVLNPVNLRGKVFPERGWHRFPLTGPWVG